MFLIDQFLVIAYLLLNYHVGNQIALSEHPFCEFVMFHIHLNKTKHRGFTEKTRKAFAIQKVAQDTGSNRT